MCSIVDFSQVLKIQMGIDLSGSDMRMSKHFLDRTQIAAGLQQVGSKRVPQDVWMHILLNTLMPCTLFQAVTDGARADRMAVLR